MTAVSVAENGDMTDSVTFEYLLAPFAREGHEKELNADYEQLSKMINTLHANLLVVGANSLVANRLKKMLQEHTSEMI